MVLDTVILSRIQFAFTIAFHILFPTLNIGLSLFIVIMEGAWLRTRNPVYLQLVKFWIKIFAMTFGMGVVSGVVLSYELGTNFGIFTDAVGSILGSLFAYEVLSAFFLEAGFLGIMLFGWDKVGPRLHYAATILVMLGTTFSAFWIMSANSWMQTPDGYVFQQGKYVVANWWHAIFNPSFSTRLLHMIFASYVATSAFVAGVSAWYLLKNRDHEISKRTFSFAMWAALIVIPIQIFFGDSNGLEVFKNQPIKTAAMEGIWTGGPSQPLLLFAIPNQRAQKNLYEIGIPYGASLFNTHQLHGVMPGLKSVAPSDQPMVLPVFFTFRIMVGIGLVLLAIALYGLWLRFRGKLFTKRWFLRLCLFATPLGFLASWAGWITAEMGRQPWIVYGLMRTADGASRVQPEHVLTSLTLFIIVYGIVFGFYIYYLLKVIRKGPETVETPSKTDPEKEEHMFHYMS